VQSFLPFNCSFVPLIYEDGLTSTIHTRTHAQEKNQGPNVEQLLKALMVRVDNYIWSETKFQEWVYEKRDAQVLLRASWSVG